MFSVSLQGRRSTEIHYGALSTMERLQLAAGAHSVFSLHTGSPPWLPLPQVKSQNYNHGDSQLHKQTWTFPQKLHLKGGRGGGGRESD